MKKEKLIEILREYKDRYKDHLKKDVFEEWENDIEDESCMNEQIDVIEEFISCIEEKVIRIDGDEIE